MSLRLERIAQTGSATEPFTPAERELLIRVFGDPLGRVVSPADQMTLPPWQIGQRVTSFYGPILLTLKGKPRDLCTPTGGWGPR